MGTNLSFFGDEVFPIEMHKVRIVQKLSLLPVEARQDALAKAGNNTFLLKNSAVFLDMLTDSGVNAMSDRQQAAMLIADDSYAGSASFDRMEAKVKDIFGKKFVLPVHQGRAAENIIAEAFVKNGDIIPMNYHFTTTRAHINLRGGQVVELMSEKALELESEELFKGNMDLDGLKKLLEDKTDKIPFVRMEAGTNLIGGQPWSIENLKAVKELCQSFNLPLVLDASLLADNLYFIKTREKAFKNTSIREITKTISELSDIIYFSARKLGCGRGGMIITNDEKAFTQMQQFIPLFEGFLTYGGMSTKEIEAITVGLEETMDFDMIRHGPEFISFMVDELKKRHIPVVTPAGGLGCHLNAKAFVSHLTQDQYPAAALAAAIFIASGVRGMERGTMSEERNKDGSEHFADVELVRLALPRRVFTLSQVKYTVDRLHWLFENRKLIGGLEWDVEPKILRFFSGKLRPVSDWQDKLVAKFKQDFKDSL